ncbi:MAG TPA: long-chain fatty acid--CoA ligase [Bacteroidetes bacterium]|nr:long-chain fatty acid--CoA ligase [Bacteroidota bacterium]
MSDYESRLRPDRGLFPLNELAENSARNFGPRPVMRTWTGNGYKEIAYTDLNDMVNAIARWLIDQGIGRGDRVAVLGENRPEWAASYLGTQTAGAAVVPVDAMMPPTGIRHILSDSESKILLTSAKFLKVVAEMENIPTLEKIVCFDEECVEDAVPFDMALQLGKESRTELPGRELDELAAILYTSGTTGHSKGVMLSQMNIMSNVASASRIFPVGPDDTFLSVLPVHHSFECTAGFLLPIYCGCSITYAHSLASQDLITDIRNTGVTMMVGVPLLFEKMHAGILRGIKKKGRKTQRLFNTMYNLVAAGEKAGLSLGGKVFKSLREKAGFSTVKFFVSGGGPLDPATAVFFNRIGIKLMQGYGLTETSPVTHVNPPWKVSHETVGPPIPGVECMIVDKKESGVGEVCIKGPNVFAGYYKNETATRKCLEENGWFHTGDLGIIREDNYLQIMGRVKNMLVTGGGKNVYPEEIEHHLNRNRFIAESLVLGVPRDSGYGEDVAALIYPDYEQVDLYFEQMSKKPSPDDVFRLIKKEIKDAQQELEDFKHVHSFRIVEEEFQKTSTRKIKRFLYSGEMLKVNNETKQG